MRDVARFYMLDGQYIGAFAGGAQPPQGAVEVLGPVDIVLPQDLSVNERAWRDAELMAVAWLRDRHRDQLEIAVDTTLSGEQFTELLLYMQALRDWPQSSGFPDTEKRPVGPSWVHE